MMWHTACMQSCHFLKTIGPPTGPTVNTSPPPRHCNVQQAQSAAAASAYTALLPLTEGHAAMWQVNSTLSAPALSLFHAGKPAKPQYNLTMSKVHCGGTLAAVHTNAATTTRDQHAVCLAESHNAPPLAMWKEAVRMHPAHHANQTPILPQPGFLANLQCERSQQAGLAWLISQS